MKQIGHGTAGAARQWLLDLIQPVSAQYCGSAKIRNGQFRGERGQNWQFWGKMGMLDKVMAYKRCSTVDILLKLVQQYRNRNMHIKTTVLISLRGDEKPCHRGFRPGQTQTALCS